MTTLAGSMLPSGSLSLPVTEKVTAVSSGVVAESSAATGASRSVMLMVWLSDATSPSLSVTSTLNVTLTAESSSPAGAKVQVPSPATFSVPSARTMSSPRSYSSPPTRTLTLAAPSAP